MMKVKKITAFILAVILIILLVGCGEYREFVAYGDFVVYGRFKDSYTTDRFEVSCNWDKINPLLDKCDFEQYGLYTNFFDNGSFIDDEEKLNIIEVYNFPSVDGCLNYDTPGSTDITYGAIWCNSVNDRNHYGEKCFKEPMIEIELYNPKAKMDIEPDYLPGYRAVYSLDGELALEEGEWFLDEDKDEFCRHYFECMLKIIGKSK